MNKNGGKTDVSETCDSQSTNSEEDDNKMGLTSSLIPAILSGLSKAWVSILQLICAPLSSSYFTQPPTSAKFSFLLYQHTFRPDLPIVDLLYHTQIRKMLNSNRDANRIAIISTEQSRENNSMEKNKKFEQFLKSFYEVPGQKKQNYFLLSATECLEQMSKSHSKKKSGTEDLFQETLFELLDGKFLDALSYAESPKAIDKFLIGKQFGLKATTSQRKIEDKVIHTLQSWILGKYIAQRIANESSPGAEAKEIIVGSILWELDYLKFGIIGWFLDKSATEINHPKLDQDRNTSNHKWLGENNVRFRFKHLAIRGKTIQSVRRIRLPVKHDEHAFEILEEQPNRWGECLDHTGFWEVITTIKLCASIRNSMLRHKQTNVRIRLWGAINFYKESKNRVRSEIECDQLEPRRYDMGFLRIILFGLLFEIRELLDQGASRAL